VTAADFQTGDAATGQWFSAWLWHPQFTSYIRGLSTAQLHVVPGLLVVRATRAEARVHDWTEIRYQWPTVVLDTHLPLRGTGILLDGADLAGFVPRLAVRGAGRLRNALTRAGFTIVEVRRWGWEAGRQIPRSALGAHAERVPPPIIRPD
jgi:hypothetical protein